jgi:hypothetical protein
LTYSATTPQLALSSYCFNHFWWVICSNLQMAQKLLRAAPLQP